MQVRVLFFGMLKDVAGRADDALDLPDGSTLADLLTYYERKFPALVRYLPAIALSVNQEYAPASAPLQDRDEVALLPPVSGGSQHQPARAPRRRSAEGEPAQAVGQSFAANVRITHSEINTREVVDGVKRPEDGAVLVFEGIVRDNTRGRRTLYLDYEAYESMAVKRMEELAERALAEFPVREVSIVHRLGRLQHTETSVLIVVASAHRGAAFDACRWLIDQLKRTVPIWKKEYFEDGAVWADGEPFPAEIPTAAPADNPPASK